MTADDLLTSFPELERVLVSELEIQQRVAELGRMLDVEYQDSHPLLIGVLTGAFIFVADLVRAMTIPLDVEFIGVSSYGLATATSGVVKFVKDLDRPVEGRDVIVVEDIIDSGLTLQYLLDILRRRGPRSLRVVALLQKNRPTQAEVPVTHVGFVIPDEFVVGYGLDAGHKFRNLPFVAVYRDGGDGAKDGNGSPAIIR